MDGLLKNDGVLPLKKNIKIALIGPNANNLSVLLGNYNGTPINPVTPLDAFKNHLGEENVFYSPGCALAEGVFTDYKTIPAENFYHAENNELLPGLVGNYFNNTGLSGIPPLSRIDRNIDFYWERNPVNNLIDKPFSVQWKGFLIPSVTGTYKFEGNVSVVINNAPVEDGINLKAGEKYEFEASLIVSSFWWSSNYQQQFAELKWVNTSVDYHAEALEEAKKGDVIVFCGGISPNLEGEEMKIKLMVLSMVIALTLICLIPRS
ncbi:MAG: beta-glucosidase, partial [Bacteroidales bacterium]|nr:beta-glucosidase [Bacteroidales bacterium]